MGAAGMSDQYASSEETVGYQIRSQDLIEKEALKNEIEFLRAEQIRIEKELHARIEIIWKKLDEEFD